MRSRGRPSVPGRGVAPLSGSRATPCRAPRTTWAGKNQRRTNSPSGLAARQGFWARPVVPRHEPVGSGTEDEVGQDMEHRATKNEAYRAVKGPRMLLRDISPRMTSCRSARKVSPERAQRQSSAARPDLPVPIYQELMQSVEPAFDPLQSLGRFGHRSTEMDAPTFLPWDLDSGTRLAARAARTAADLVGPTRGSSPAAPTARARCSSRASGTKWRLSGSNGSSDADRGRRRPMTRANTAGRTSSVASVDGGQPADHRPAERGGLLAALAQAQRHRHHAGDHGAGWSSGSAAAGRRRPSTAASRAERPAPAAPLGERDQQDGVGHRHADGHDRPHERLEVERRPGQPAARATTPASTAGTVATATSASRTDWKYAVSSRKMTTTDDRQADRQPAEHLPHRRDLAADVDLHPLGGVAGRARRPRRPGRRPGPGPRPRCWPSGSPAAACCSGRPRRASCPRVTSATSRSSSGGPPLRLTGIGLDVARPSSSAAAGSRPAPGSRCRSSGRASSSGTTNRLDDVAATSDRATSSAVTPLEAGLLAVDRRPRPSGSRAPGRTAGRAATGSSASSSRTFSA